MCDDVHYTDPEIDAMETAYEALRNLNPSTRGRIMHWLTLRLEADRRAAIISDTSNLADAEGGE